MPHVKKLVMHGFKSFARKTELAMDEGINVILGPNGSGKSNVTDALCFVLGRLSVKSMRAAKAKNLIFMGTKAAPPSKEASVEMVFDNSDQTFAVNKKEVSIKRIVRKNGQSIYKINGETKTRQEVLALLAQAGIDPNGFNIILQGEIQNFVKMHTEERRKIIEEVSGISIYESRKQKSLKELGKTEEKLKEVSAVLRERTAYLNNLERERQQALKFKKLERDVKRYKASIIYSDLTKKKKEEKRVLEEIEKKEKDILKVKKSIEELEITIRQLESKINYINSTIQKEAGLEQEKLNQEIANLRADIAGQTVKLENSEKKLREVERGKVDIKEGLKDVEEKIKDLEKESPTVAKKSKEIEIKKKKLEELEKERKKFYMDKTELKSIKTRLEDKKTILHSYKNESDFVLKQLESLSSDLFDKNTTTEKVEEIKHILEQKRKQIEIINSREMELEKVIHTNTYEIEKQDSLTKKIASMDVCPLCKNKITEDHIHSIKDEVKPKVTSLQTEIDSAKKELDDILSKRVDAKGKIEKAIIEISRRESDLTKLRNIQDKKSQIKVLQEKIEEGTAEIKALEKKMNNMELNFDETSNVESRYENLRIEVQEISLRTEENVNSEISFKRRELERQRVALKQLMSQEDEINEEIIEIRKSLEQKTTILQKRRETEEELSKKFKSSIRERDSIQGKIREQESILSTKQNLVYNIEQDMNNLKIEKAKYDAEVESLETEMLEFPNIEVIKTNKDSLLQKLNKCQNILSTIGSVNMRSLDVYDEIKKEYDSIREKVEVISKEKEGIMKIIHEIDIKKKKTFLKTLTELNEIFSRNFAQISTKGQVSLELENRKDPFEGGVNVIVKTGHGKFFDVTSLSGGEQTMVALSLIFAIQELSPYCFYILDEIDAALDKRNSERLANLLKKYMQKGQYIVITHNDEIITNATNLYGVSMHDGVSKVISMKL